MKRVILYFFVNLFFVVAINYSNAGYSDNPGASILNNGHNELEVSIFPNPFTGSQLTVQANKDFYSVEILDIVGKVVYFEEFKSKVSKAVLDFDNADKGMYIVRVKFDDKNIHTEKIIVK